MIPLQGIRGAVVWAAEWAAAVVVVGAVVLITHSPWGR